MEHKARLKVWDKITWRRNSRMFSGDPRKQYLLCQNGHFYHTRKIKVIFIWALKKKTFSINEGVQRQNQ